eukprot:TRINITY_DN7221_c0_g1_i1.p1 TRINITY_DN7221_c0_g1~~TRINITY_DN7221_c0_g1_i1.p1  ORF type:complete len:193 (-),score=49.94 TRINITY_DN7221_c0_g1_i1:91-621(-)
MFTRSLLLAAAPLARTHLLRAHAPLAGVRAYADDAAAAVQVPSDRVKFSLATPNETFFDNVDVDSVLVPGAEGAFAIKPLIVPIIAEMQAGVVEVSTLEEGVKKFFVSGGWAFVYKDGTSTVSATEAVPLEELSLEDATKTLEEAKSELNNAHDDYDKAVAQISVNTSEAVIAALK